MKRLSLIVLVCLLAAPSSAIAAQADYDVYTAFMEAAANGQADQVRMLLDAGADVDAASEFGDTALILAAESGRHEIVEMLLGAGADINAANSYGNTALVRAARRGNKEIVEILLGQPGIIRGDAANIARKAGHGEIAEMIEGSPGGLTKSANKR